MCEFEETGYFRITQEILDRDFAKESKSLGVKVSSISTERREDSVFNRYYAASKADGGTGV